MPQFTRTFRVTNVQHQAGNAPSDPVTSGLQLSPVLPNAAPGAPVPVGLFAGMAGPQPLALGGLTPAEVAGLAPNGEVTVTVSWGGGGAGGAG